MKHTIESPSFRVRRLLLGVGLPLLFLALGFAPDQLGLNKLMIAPDTVVDRVASA